MSKLKFLCDYDTSKKCPASGRCETATAVVNMHQCIRKSLLAAPIMNFTEYQRYDLQQFKICLTNYANKSVDYL